MAATYAALTSVLGTIDKLLRSNLLVGVEEVHKQQLESLDEMFGTLQVSLIGKCDGEEPIISKDLQGIIKDVAVDAEDEVESLMKQLIVGLNDDDDKCCRAKFDKVSQHVIQVTHSVNEELIINNINCQEKADENSDVSPRLDDSIRENVMEGYNEERENMVERLTKSSGANKLQVVSVVGMAGIGIWTWSKSMDTIKQKEAR
ncbi:uncharacterized protein LOC107016353 [Solanum pennellii]|uniref:Uncharacterized protein LOC107016353 n=1 Tax=Solanum pennellii TaxID=28526 RepID=A0ABM1GKJ8_SOLPN|nr:uncharacterized protein LOC107016353 [Solanum pennellii]